MRILVTRPEPDASALAERLQALGFEPILQPLLEFQPLKIEPSTFEQVSGVIITSGNALRPLHGFRGLDFLLGLPLYCVGEKTAQKALEMGFRRIEAVAESAQTLSEEIAAKAEGLLVHFNSAHRAFDLDKSLINHGIALRVVNVYDMAARTAFDAGVLDKLENGMIDGVILMSARTAETFVTLCRKYRIEARIAKLRYFCISQAVATRLASLAAEQIRIAKAPTKQGILEVVTHEWEASPNHHTITVRSDNIH